MLVQAYRVKGSSGRKGSITVRMWSTKTYDKVVATDPVRSNFTTGRDIEDDAPGCESRVSGARLRRQVSRLFYDDGKVVKRERFYWRYAPTNRITCTGS